MGPLTSLTIVLVEAVIRRIEELIERDRWSNIGSIMRRLFEIDWLDGFMFRSGVRQIGVLRGRS